MAFLVISCHIISKTRNQWWIFMGHIVSCSAVVSPWLTSSSFKSKNLSKIGIKSNFLPYLVNKLTASLKLLWFWGRSTKNFQLTSTAFLVLTSVFQVKAVTGTWSHGIPLNEFNCIVSVHCLQSMNIIYLKNNNCQLTNDDIFRQQADWSHDKAVQLLSDSQERGGVSISQEKLIHE